MSTTITIPTELERKIAVRAATQGKDIEQFVLEALERAAETPSLRELFADVREEAEANGISEEDVEVAVESAVQEVRKRRRA
jgi:pantoate kinase